MSQVKTIGSFSSTKEEKRIHYINYYRVYSILLLFTFSSKKSFYCVMTFVSFLINMNKHDNIFTALHLFDIF